MAIAALVIRQQGSVKNFEKLAIYQDSSASLLHKATAQWRWEQLAEIPRCK